MLINPSLGNSRNFFRTYKNALEKLNAGIPVMAGIL